MTKQLIQRIASAIMFLVVVLAVFSSTGECQSAVKFDSDRAIYVSFPLLSATGTTNPVLLDSVPSNHAVQVVTTGAPAACTYDTEVSLDGGTSWHKAVTATACTTSGTITFTTGQAYLMLRFNLTALSGGATAKFYYVGSR